MNISLDSNFADKCEGCPLIDITSGEHVAYTDSRPVLVVLTCSCKHKELCDSIEMYLRASLTPKEEKENKQNE